MKKLLFTVTLGMTIALSGPSAFSETAKKDMTPPAAAKTAEKAIPMYSRVDGIDAKAMTFTHKNKDGKEVKLVVTAKTEIKNGDKSAKFEEIKIGDFISGTRMKKMETEYEVVKITKFGPEMKKTTEPKTKQ